MNKNTINIVGFRQRDESKGVEYVFCKECSDRENVPIDRGITRDEAKRDLFFCDVCEDRLQ